MAIVAATWGVVLRIMVGRREASSKRQEARLQKVEESVQQISIDLATIAAIIKERGRDGRHTWPHGHQ